MNNRMSILTVAMVTLTLQLAASACNVPVFLYALEKWQPDEYSAVIFHRGKLNEPDAAALKDFKARIADENVPVNISLSTVDVEGSIPPEYQELAATLKPERLPRMVIMRPIAGGVLGGKVENLVVWSGTFESASVAGLLDSPCRRETASRLLRGDSIAWLLVESGDKAKDAAVAQSLSGNLSELQGTIKITAHTGNEGEVPESSKLSLPVITVPAGNPAESNFVCMLRALAKADGILADGPLVIPVFGRGRALTIMAGKDIGRAALADVCAYLAGACSCEVKNQNPGYDLLMAVGWDVVEQGTYVKDVPAPDLTGVMPLINQSGSVIVAQSGHVNDSSRDNPAPSKGALVKKTVWVMILGVLVVAVVSAIVIRRPGWKPKE